MPKNLFSAPSTAEPKPQVKKTTTLAVARAPPTPKGATIPKKIEKPLDRREMAAAVLRARREAAEKGREAVKAWAEQKKAQEARRAAARAAGKEGEVGKEGEGVAAE